MHKKQEEDEGMNNRTNYQGGSLLGFVIVGVLLTVVLIGGLYGLQTYTNGLKKTGDEVAVDTKKAANDKKDDQSTSDSTDKTPAKTDNNSASNNKDTTKAAGETPATSEDATESVSAGELPATGPTSSALQFIGIGVLTFAVTAYVRSRYAL